MKVSARAEYGIRALIELAAHYGRGPIHSQDIATRQRLPEPYLHQLMTALRGAGLVVSKRGPSGGHALSRPPEQITLREVFAVLEGTTAPWWCVEEDAPGCEYASDCVLQPVWRAVRGAAESVLDRLTLADLRADGLRQPVARK